MPVYAWVIEGLTSDQTFNVVRHMYIPGPGEQMSNLVNSFAASLKAAVQPYTHEDTTYQSIRVRQVGENQIGVEYLPSGWPFSGLMTETEPLPVFCAFGIKYRGAEVKHPARGSNRFPGFCESQTLGNIWTPTFINDMVDLVNVMSLRSVLGPNGNEYNPCIWSEKYQDYNLIAQAQPEGYVTTQNSRKIGRGR